MTEPFRIAVAGKGGTGKTTISSLLVRSFVALGETPVLAVDADPNANLHEALGLDVKETLGCMREEAFTKSIPPGMSRHDFIRYRFRQVLVEAEGFDLIAMGRPEGTGCYCFANDLLGECMRTLEREYRLIIEDTEAGMEHISRGTVGRPDVLLIVSDPGARGLRTAARIREIATSLGLDPKASYLVFNRQKSVPGGDAVAHEPPVATIPYDPAIEQADLEGTPVADIPEGSPARVAVRELAEKILAMRTES
ncbi:MAG: AAA family ATPase [Methanoregulaceae archaeon]